MQMLSVLFLAHRAFMHNNKTAVQQSWQNTLWCNICS